MLTRTLISFTLISLCCSFIKLPKIRILHHLSMSNQNYEYLHIAEYPNDNYDHILGYKNPEHSLSKLQIISRDRIKDVKLSKTPIDTQGCGIDRSFYVSSEDLEQEIIEFDETYGEPVNIQHSILSKAPQIAIAAEFKRASPSKGDLNLNVDVVEQCLNYANMGAAIISILTEAKYFKGTLQDMKRVRLATQKVLGKDKRPAILRKDFIFDRYQILEARSHGADTVLLIVAVLGVNQLKDLITYSRKYGMEPLVEVHTQEEMRIALKCGAKVIGVNNRNLHTFQLDLETTEKALLIASEQGINWKYDINTHGNTYPDITIVSLSGVTSSQDVQQFKKLGVSGVLVGETLMKSSDPKKTIQELLSDSPSDQADNALATRNIIKICGFTQPEDVQIALQNTVNLIGLIFASSKRSVSDNNAKIITEIVQKYGERTGRLVSFDQEIKKLKQDKLTPKLYYNRCMDLIKKTTVRRPLTVGVFQDQPAELVNEKIASLGLDLIQLHGNETPEYIDSIHAPCIKVIHAVPSGYTQVSHDHIVQEIDSYANKAIAVLLDSRIPGTAGGGTGLTFDWNIALQLQRPVLLAGGLSPENVKDAVKLDSTLIVGVDVSSGVEIEDKPGVKDINKLKAFTTNARL